MGQALYRKHRPKGLKDVVGQEHITDTLQHALDSGRISHAYLFTGPRGVGKTSIARILAHAINDLPYDDDSTHMDIIEIDAASNRRIDEIRDLRDKVYVAPTSAKYKVYIIDEVHMLTREAFNALLKTLEEPPEHVVFILATTDAHKLPETIISRTQRFTFKPVEQAKVIAHLKSIAKEEKLAVSDDALALLAEHGEGSFRDSISLLDQAANQTGKLELSDVQTLLGIPPLEALQSLVTQLATGQSASVVSGLSALYDQGFQAAAIAKQLGGLLRQQLIAQQSPLSHEQTLGLLAALLEVAPAHDPERYLEITLLKALPSVPQQAATVAVAAPRPVTSAPKTEAKPKAAAPAPEPEPVTEVVEAVEEIVDEPPTNVTAVVDASIWPQILSALKAKYNTLYGVIRMAEPIFTDEDKLELRFTFAFHQKRVSEAKNQEILADIVKQVTGRKIHITCVLDPKAKPSDAKIAPEPTQSTDLSAISNIFGGGELIDS